MLDPRIYRTGVAIVAMAVLILAFSLSNQQSAVSSSLAPDAFNGQNVFDTMQALGGPTGVGDRRPGSAGDDALASQVAQSFRTHGFSVSTDAFTGVTADGPRTLENVVASRPGMQSGSIVVVAHRDARSSPALASLSGTATLMELARDLEGETLSRTIVLASVSGSQGTAGALRLAETLNGPIDAVLVLGDLASRTPRQPIVVPWSGRPLVAPPLLRNTVTAAIGQQATIPVEGASVVGQFLHLAFPLTVTEQAPFGDKGIPAVAISLSGERGAAPDAPLGGVAQVTGMGRAVLSTISALDSGPAVPSASAYVLLDNKVIPGWAISLLVLALLVPVILTTIDGLARARRRGHQLWRWLVLTVAGAVPFALIVLVVLVAHLLGGLAAAPPGPLPAGAVPVSTGGWVIMVLAGLAGIGSGVLLRPVLVAFARPRARSRGPGRDTALEGAVPGLLAVACVSAIALWVSDPYAALLAVPGLHLWLLAVSPGLRLRVFVRAALLLVGLLPLLAVPVYYGISLGYSPLQEIWTAVLLLAGHGVSLVTTLEWCLYLGCLLTAAGILVALARLPRPEPAPVTVRGPVGYAGPGSLGGTSSALRR